MRVRFTRPARADLDAIYAYVSRTDPKIAALIVRRVIERAEALSRHPYTGRPADHPGIRVAALPRYRYLIFYRITDEEVHVLHVRHMSRRPWAGEEDRRCPDASDHCPIIADTA